MTTSFSEGESHPAFYDSAVYKTSGGFRQLMNSHDIASYIHSQNEVFDAEGMPSRPKSMALFLWARWLEGDRDVEDRLMHAIAARFWRITSDKTRDLIRGITLYAHAHLFYNMGWNPVSMGSDLPGAHSDLMCHLSGRSIPLAGKNDLMVDPAEQQAGSLLFNCIPRVPMSVCDSAGFTLDESRTLYPVANVRLPIASFKNDGVAVMGTLGTEKVMYFLEYPGEYEEGALMVWDMMDRAF
jgi:hypothetical protein